MGIGDTWQLSKVSKLFFQMRVHACSLFDLTKLKVGGRSFLEGAGEGFRVRSPPRALSCYKRLKDVLLCEI